MDKERLWLSSHEKNAEGEKELLDSRQMSIGYLSMEAG